MGTLHAGELIVPTGLKKRQVNKICRRNKVLNGNNFFYAISLFAQKKTLKEIQALMKDNLKVDISIMALSKFYNKNKDIIDSEEQKIVSAQLGAPIGTEKVRLERDEALYTLSQTLEDTKEKVYAGLACIKEAREETKVSVNGTNNFQFNQFVELNNKQLLDKIKKVKLEVFEMTKKEGGEYACKE